MKRNNWSDSVFLSILVAVFLSLPASVRADEVQFGVTGSGLQHFDDSFSGGVYRFRPGLSDGFQRYVRYRGFPAYNTGEAFVRFSGPLGDEHSFGLALGEETVSGAHTLEYRGGYFTRVQHEFQFEYILFTYHYGIPIRSYFRNLSVQIGGGLGFVPLTQWSLKGYETDLGQYYEKYNAVLESSSGFQYRLDMALQKKWAYMFMDLGVRLDYRMAYDFSGTANKTDIYAFTLADGTHSLTPDMLDIIDVNQQVKNQYLNFPLHYQGLVQHSLQSTWSTMGIFLSVGFRF